MQIVNWGLAKHPLNWLTIILMVMIGGAAFHFLVAHIQLRDDTQKQAS